MRLIVIGFTGWARMQDTENETVRVVDAAITVVGTLLVALAWIIIRR